MTEYLTEQEQIQQLKTWVKNYGFTILLGIAIALLISTGWHIWQKRQNKILTHASRVFDVMISMRNQNDLANSQAQAQKLLRHYAKTPYGDMAALMMARDAILIKDYTSAKKHLIWTLDHSRSATTRQIARLRLARVFIEERKADSALEYLTKIEDKTYMGSINETRGDAYVVKKDFVKAKHFYENALKELPNAELTRPILEMKINNLVI